MCGIAGFISSNKNYNSKKIVSNMLDLIPHRGPDQKGFDSFDDTTMGMVRLSIIDCKDHDIPLVDNSGNYAIVYNGEIYNHDSIKNSLKSKSSPSLCLALKTETPISLSSLDKYSAFLTILSIT